MWWLWGYQVSPQGNENLPVWATSSTRCVQRAFLREGSFCLWCTLFAICFLYLVAGSRDISFCIESDRGVRFGCCRVGHDHDHGVVFGCKMPFLKQCNGQGGLHTENWRWGRGRTWCKPLKDKNEEDGVSLFVTKNDEDTVYDA